jgi:hypothetical protein
MGSYKDWSCFPRHAQNAAQNLGFTYQMWDSDEWFAVGDNERKGLYTLGYYGRYSGVNSSQ